MKMLKLISTIALILLLSACGGDKQDSNSQDSVSINQDDNKVNNDTQNEANVESNNTKSSSEAQTKESKKAESTPQTTAESKESQNVATKNASDLYRKCIACHGVNGDKVAPGSNGNVKISSLSKQSIIEDLEGYRAKTLNKGGSAATMYLQANSLSDDDIEILSEYIVSLKK